MELTIFIVTYFILLPFLLYKIFLNPETKKFPVFTSVTYFFILILLSKPIILMYPEYFVNDYKSTNNYIFSLNIYKISSLFTPYIVLFVLFIIIPYLLYKMKELGIFLLVIYFPVVTILILTPNFASINDQNKDAFVKSNMHTFQTILETYSVDASGFYPKNVEELHKFSSTGNNQYWKDFKNSYTYKYGKGISYDDLQKISKKTKKIEGFFFDKQFMVLEGKMGVVYYEPITNKQGQVFKYFIYGGGKHNELLVNSKTDEIFTLTNN